MMKNFTATYTEITDWQKNVHYSTGGTRSKYIALDPNLNEEFFFKGSKVTSNGIIRYPTEFWSEIVSSKIGQFLGFNMLDYNIGYDRNHNQKIGCLSKSMILNSENKLTEGIQYLTGFNPNYNPDTDKTDYTFQFIYSALDSFNLQEYIENIIEIIVFDSIIGNSDRHQENWSIITKHKMEIQGIATEVDGVSRVEHRGLMRKIRRLRNFFLSDKNATFEKTLESLNYTVTFNKSHRFAPIYDSGCCLGREYEEERINKMLSNIQMLNTYINKGKSEIHWNGLVQKSSHFELVNLLLKEYPKQTAKFIHRINEAFDEKKIKEIIDNIDSKLPADLINYKLSKSRKTLMFKLITLRIEKLVNLI